MCRTPRQVPGRPHKGFSAAALSLECFPIRTIPHLRHYMYVIVVQKGRFVKPLRHGSLPSFIRETLHPMNHVPLNRCSFQPLRNRILRFDKVLFSPRTSAQKKFPVADWGISQALNVSVHMPRPHADRPSGSLPFSWLIAVLPFTRLQRVPFSDSLQSNQYTSFICR